ncbi:MAG: hypothetical protein K6T63_10920, partial [Alicyclobacillus herbarius]|nr:hypothetical protein [Alicyclobacillus herbarius]
MVPPNFSLGHVALNASPGPHLRITYAPGAVLAEDSFGLPGTCWKVVSVRTFVGALAAYGAILSDTRSIRRRVLRHRISESKFVVHYNPLSEQVNPANVTVSNTVVFLSQIQLIPLQRRSTTGFAPAPAGGAAAAA